MFDAMTALSNAGGRYELHVTPVTTGNDNGGVQNVAAVSLRCYLPNGEGGFVRLDTINGTLRRWVNKGTHTVNWGNSRNFSFPDAVLGKGMNDIVGPNIILAIIAKTKGNKVIFTFYKNQEGKLVIEPRRTVQELNDNAGRILDSIDTQDTVVPSQSKEIFIGETDEDLTSTATNDDVSMQE